MRKIYIQVIAFALFLVPALLNAQYDYVSTMPQNRTIVMEEFTGVNCGYCPQGHAIAQQIADENPGTVLINIHAGSFATPRSGQPDFRTTHGTTINNGFGVNAYPSGMVNRYNAGGGVVVGRGSWAGYAEAINELPSPVNVGTVSTFDPMTRELTVDVEVYYTDDAPEAQNFLSVIFLESGVIGYQADYNLPAGSVPNYEHNHILREKLHGQTFGDIIATTTEGTYQKYTYTYTVPGSFKIENCDVAAFVAGSRENIYQGVKVKADGGSTLQIGGFDQPDDVYTQVGKDGFFNENLTLNSSLDDGEEFKVTLMSLDAPVSWKTNLIVDGSAVGNEATFAITGSKDIQLAVVPSGEHGVGRYMLEMTSVANPDAPGRFKAFNIITDVTDLVLVTGADVPNFVDVEGPYTDGLAYAQRDDVAATDAKTAAAFIENNALDGVNNIYFSVGWTFPSLTDGSVAALSTFLDNGGNLMITGQDIGWDTWDPSGNGTPQTQSFWTEYLKCRYLGDGSSATRTLNANTDDALFGQVGSADIVSVYGSGSSGPYVYPEEVLPLGGANEIFRYENNRIGGVRVKTDNYKVVYIGVGLEMLANDPDIAQEIVKISHDWFYGLISSTEFDRAMAAIQLGNAFPNPAVDHLTIPVSGNWDGDLMVEVRDILGNLVLRRDINNSDNIRLDLEGLSSGTYVYHLTDGKHVGQAKKFAIVK